MELTAPYALAGIALVALVLWLGRRRGAPTPRFTGAFSLWTAEDARPVEGARRHRIPPARWVLAIAILFASLALAGPVLHGGASRPAIEVLVDSTPSMLLGGVGDGTRRDAASLALREWGLGLPAPSETDLLPARGPESFRDAPDVVWVTDRVPDPLPRHAGVVATGGEAVPGWISVADGVGSWWNGEVVESRPYTEDRWVTLDRDLPDPVVRLVDVWAADRGLRVDSGEGSAALAVERGATPGAAFDSTLRGPGWSSAVRVAGRPLGRAVLAVQGPDGPRPVVGVGRGWFDVAIDRMDDPEGDPAAFVLAWSAWLDEALLPPRGVIPIEERQDAGQAFTRPPGVMQDSVREGATDLAPWLAAAAALAAALALGLSMNGRAL